MVFAVGLTSWSLAAQDRWRTPILSIDLDDPGRQRASLSLTMPVPPPVAQAFSQAMGCPLAAAPPETSRPTTVQVDCPSHLRKDGLRWTAHWDFTALNAELIRGGAETMQIYINHARSGFSKVRPASIPESRLPRRSQFLDCHPR
jgi:hypothetical protein